MVRVKGIELKLLRAYSHDRIKRTAKKKGLPDYVRRFYYYSY